MAKDLQYGAQVIRRILKQLDKPDSLAHKFAEAILKQAVINASERPTPQAPMAAANMTIERDTIAPAAGGAPADVAIGSEFGSTLYRQFRAQPNPRGYWLYPAGRSLTVLAEGDKALEEVIDHAIRSVI